MDPTRDEPVPLSHATFGPTGFDRYRIVITESDFLIEMTGLDPRLKAQVIAQLEAEELVE